MNTRNTMIAAGLIASFATAVSAAFVDHDGFPGMLRNAIALQADEGVPRNLVTALKADEGVPQNLVTA